MANTISWDATVKDISGDAFEAFFFNSLCILWAVDVQETMKSGDFCHVTFLVLAM